MKYTGPEITQECIDAAMEANKITNRVMTEPLMTMEPSPKIQGEWIAFNKGILEFDKAGRVTVQVFSLQGEKLSSEIMTSKKMDLNNLPYKGVLLIKVKAVHRAWSGKWVAL